VPPVGAVDRLRSGGRKVIGNPWLAVGTVVGLLLVCAWIGWAIHVWSEHSARQGLGVLVVWPAIVAVLAVISIPFVWAFRVIRAGAGSEDSEENAEAEAEAEAESADDEVPEDESGAEPSAAS
jgi:type VI protein secretion system component VasK